MEDRSFNHTIPPIDSIHWLTDILDVLKVYLVIVIIAFGFMGNCLSITIFIKTKRLDSASASYLVPLAFSDLSNIIFAFSFWLSNGGLGLYQYATVSYGCSVYIFFYYWLQYMSGFIILAFSFERFLVVWWPLKMAPLMNTKLRRKIILGVFIPSPLFLVSFGTESKVMYHPDKYMTACVPPADDWPFTYFYLFITLGLSCTIPCVLVACINILILIGVWRGSQRRQKMTDSDTASKNDQRCLRNLLLVSSFYVVFMLPFGISWTLVSIILPDSNTIFDAIAMYSINWSYFNYSINCILYSFTLKFYRHEALKILTCGCYGKTISTDS